MDLRENIGEKAQLTGLLNGDKRAFGEIYLKHHAPLCYFAEKLLGSEGEAQDIVDDVFLRLWEHGKMFRDYEHLKAFLYHATRNACLDRLRSVKRKAERERRYATAHNVPQESYLAEITRTEVLTELYAALSSLPGQAGKIIRKTYLEGKTNEEVAEEMNISIHTVKNQKRRALAILRGKLSRDGYMILLILGGLS